MTTGEYLSSPIFFVTLVIGVVGSLFACHSLAARIWFTLVTPIAYGFVWFICMLGVGSIVGLLFPRLVGSSYEFVVLTAVRSKVGRDPGDCMEWKCLQAGLERRRGLRGLVWWGKGVGFAGSQKNFLTLLVSRYCYFTL